MARNRGQVMNGFNNDSMQCGEPKNDLYLQFLKTVSGDNWLQINRIIKQMYCVMGLQWTIN